MALAATKKRTCRVFFFVFLSFLLTFSTSAQSENSLPTILIDAHDKLNLVGFLPPEKRPVYDLEVTPTSQAVLDAVQSGKALLGFVSPLDFLQAVSRGVPVVAVANPLQYTPVAFAYKKNVFRRSFEDFKGQRVLYEPGSLGEILFKQFLRRINIAPSELEWIPLAPGAEKGYQNADIVILDQISEVVHFSRNKETDRILYPHEFGIFFTGPLLVTARKTLETQTEAVKTLAAESLEIFQSNLFDQKNIYGVLLQRTVPYVLQPDEAMGMVTERDWWYMERSLLEEGAIAEPVAPKDLFSPLIFKSPRRPAHEVIIALPGLPSADFAGFYAAEDNGYYDRNDRPVALEHLATESDVISAVRKNDVLIGVASAATLLEAQSQAPDLTILGVIYQKDPSVLIELEEPNAKGKPDLGKKVITIDERGTGALLAALQPLPLKKGDLTLAAPQYADAFTLLDGRADVIASRFTFEDSRFDQYQETFKEFAPSNEGVLGLTLFTTRKTYDQNRDLIKSLLKSTFHGYENSIFQTNETAESIMNRDSGSSFKDLKRILKENSQYIKDNHGIIGSIDPSKWQELAELELSKGFIEKMPDFKDFFPEEVKRPEESAK